MRVTFNDKLTTVSFVADLPNGGTRVSCGKCNGENDLPLTASIRAEFCRHCDAEMLYPGWAEW